MQGIRLLAAVIAAFIVCGVGMAFASQDESESVGPPVENAPNALAAEKTDPEAAEELPHEDLGREEALELASAVFNPELQSPAGIFDELEVEKFYADNVAVIEAGDQPELGGESGGAEEPTLLESTTPLATEDAEGHRETVDLSLEHSEGELRPVNPLVDVGIPGQLEDGITLPDTGVEISLADAPADRAPTIAEQSTAFYPNVAADTDLTIAPTPDGVETLTQLRSPDAPRSQTFELTLPNGAKLQESEAGGAEVLQGEKAVVVIPPPTAIDAEGKPVPVSLHVSGNSLTLTSSPSEDASYPILVDPLYEQPYVWMWNHTHAGMYDWTRTLNAQAKPTPWAFTLAEEGYITGVGMFPGLTVQTDTSTVALNSQASWNYYVPRYETDYQQKEVRPTSFIKTFRFTDSGTRLTRDSFAL